MGLDGVEIVMSVEDAFSISVDDSAAGKLRTPRDLIEFILTKVKRADTKDCLTQRSFNLLRASLMRNLPLKRRDVAPSVGMVGLVQKPIRRKVLEQIAAELQAGPIPPLVRPQWLVTLLTGCSLAAGILSAVA